MPRTSLLALLVLSFGSAVHAAEAPNADLAKTLDAIRERALTDDWAYHRLADLTDKVGPRLSGSPGAEAAVEQVAAAMRADGFTVTLQPVKVPHWVRGEEQAELVDYPGRPKGLLQHLHLTTLGGSVATPANGIAAPVLVVKTFDELAARAGEARGKIVLFDEPFDQNLADNGNAMQAYGQAVAYRGLGAIAAARAGAVAALVRSVGGADFRLPHTGAMRYNDDVAKIPTAALSAEDAGLVARLAAQGAVSMRLLLTPQTLPDADSHNVIADFPGSEHPEEIVLISGHLDSWDLATGAIDDGAGVTAAMGVAHVLKSLNLHPRRTIRVVAWMNEENGGRGADAYFAANRTLVAQHAAVIESDSGAGRPMGFDARISNASLASLQPVVEALTPIGAAVLNRTERPVGSDIAALQMAGVPGFEPQLDTRHYFDYHHTPADTLDKVDPQNFNRIVAAMAVLAYQLAQMPAQLEHLPPVSQ
jgi:carboxypeptidase Q